MTVRATGLCLLIVGLLAGCSTDPKSGYTMRPLHPSDIKSVALPIGNRGQKVYSRDLEFLLTEAVRKRIEMDTRYKVIDKSKADTLLTFTIDNVNQHVMSMNPHTGMPRDVEVQFVITMTWTDLRPGRSGNILVGPVTVTGTSTYILYNAALPTPHAPNFNEDFFLGSEGAINTAAKRMVEQMEADWGNS